MHFYVYDKLRL